MGKIEKSEPMYPRWMEIFIVLTAAVMIFFGWKEYKLTKRAEKLQENQIMAEQIKAGQLAPGEAEIKQSAPGETETERMKEEQPSQRQTPEQQAAAKQNAAEKIAVQESEQTNDYPAIRVLLVNTDQDSYIQNNVILQASGKMSISGAYTRDYDAGVPFDAGELLCEGETIWVSPGEDTDKSITVLSLQRSQGIPSYEGILEIHRGSSGLYIVNEVALETYLKYVVPSEMPSDYPQEALKAQAVCARTYAVRQMQEESLKEYGADVDDTVSYQVYNNIGRQETTDLAVDETAGEIICWNHEPIQAYFFSTSCGFTSSDEVWTDGTPAEYLKSISLSEQSVEALAAGDMKTDTVLNRKLGNAEFEQYILGKNSLDYESEEPWYRWEICIPWEELEKRAKLRFPQTGKLQDFQVLERSSGGAVTKLCIRGADGETVLENEYNIREFLSPGQEAVILQDGTYNTSMKILPSAYILFEKVMENNRPSGLYVRGGGYGHGVGMSQNGAKCLAQDGMNWEQILSVFYRDTAIETISGNQQNPE